MATEYFNDAWRIPNNKNQSLVSNYSMEFDGTNDSINVGLIEPFNNDVSNFAISYWIKADFLDPNRPYNSALIHLDFRYNGANKGVAIESSANEVIFYTAGGLGYNTTWSTPTSGLNNNEWNHIVLNFDGSIVADADKAEFWINGSKKTSTVTNPGNNYIKAITGDGFLGNGFNPYPLEGKLDQFCTFDYTLLASQIPTLYGGGTAVTNPMGLSPAPVAYYQLGDQSVDNGANYLVPNNSLQDYVFNLITGDYISFANGSTMARQQNISYSAWVNTTNLSTTQYIVGNNTSSNQGTSIFILNSASYPDRLVFQFGDIVNFNNQSYFNSIVSNLSTYVSANEWFHVAASWDGTTSKIYINGIERNSWTPTQPPAYTISNWSSFRIGRRGDLGTSYFNGMLSNVAFWDNGLTPSQMTKLYNNGVPGDISSLSPVSWWKLNAQDTFDGTDWTIKDSAGSNDGTSVNMNSANLVQSNLQHTSGGYSPYALTLDGTDQFLEVPFSSDLRLTNVDFTISFWTKPSATGRYIMLENYSPTVGWGVFNDNGILEFLQDSGTWLVTSVTIPNNVWTHIVLVGDISATNLQVYKNGVSAGNFNTNLVTGNATGPLTIGAQRNGAGGFDYNGDLSNLSIWSGTALSSIEVTEVYNQGVPSNLNTFSGTKPTAWWQLGTNSSFNATPSQWTCLDEIGTNNAVSSTNMANDDITNGVGYSANGLGTSSIDIVGDAPYSTANGLSENMDVLDRVRDVAPFVVIDNSLQFTVQMGAGETFVFPGSNGAAVFKIDWGQGAGFQDVTGTNNTSPAYATAGLYTVRVFDATTVNFQNFTAANKAKIRALQNWGDSTWITLVNSFRNIPNLTITATDYPDLSTATDLQYSFSGSPFPGSTNFTGWDVSNIQTFNSMFANTLPSGSIDLSNWDMSSATNINSMISGVDGDVGDITGWDVSNVTGGGFVSFMNGNTFFNQDISSWDASNATNFVNFLRGAVFNQNMGTLSLGAGLITMQYMCYFNGMNTENYTDTFVGFANQVKTNGFPYNVNAANQNGRTYNNARPGGSNFANAAAARTFLTSSVASGGAGWSIASDTVIN